MTNIKIPEDIVQRVGDRLEKDESPPLKQPVSRDAADVQMLEQFNKAQERLFKRADKHEQEVGAFEAKEAVEHTIDVFSGKPKK